MLDRFIFKMILAIVLGGLIGLERQLKHKAAGLKTNVLIALGSALFTAISTEIGRATHSEGHRIAAQVITGVGFLGAGVIIQSRGSIQGLTTAATIFVVAGIGMAIGSDFYLHACAVTLIIVGVLYGLGRAEHRFFPHYQNYDYSIPAKDPIRVYTKITQVLKEHNLQAEDISFRQDDHETLVNFTITTTAGIHSQLMPQLLKMGDT